MKAILITAEAAPVVVDIPSDEDADGGTTLAELQRILVGRIEALPFPYSSEATVYIDDESKFNKSPNPAATAMMAPILQPGDAIYGPMLVCGFDASRGRTIEVPQVLIDQFVAGLTPEAGDMGRADGLGAN
jgi:hypothetical protein